MSAKDRRRRAHGTLASQQPAQAAARPEHQPVPMPAWRWRTFPVYFMFAVGGFIGLYMGLVAGATGNATISLIVFVFWALLLGFGLSRFTSRWMISRGWHRTSRKRAR